MSQPESRDPAAMNQQTSGEAAGVPAHGRATAGQRSKVFQIVTIVVLVLGLLTAVFVAQNTRTIEIVFFFWTVHAPLAAALLLALVIGGTLAFLVAFVRQRQYRRAARREHQMHAE